MQDLKDLKSRFFEKWFRRRGGENPANPIILQILIQTTEGSRGTGPRATVSKQSPLTVGRGPVPRHAWDTMNVREGQALALR